jgi:hypothetical protein
MQDKAGTSISPGQPLQLDEQACGGDGWMDGWRGAVTCTEYGTNVEWYAGSNHKGGKVVGVYQRRRKRLGDKVVAMVQ